MRNRTAALLALLTGAALGADLTGSIEGTITDPSAFAAAGAAVTVREVVTGDQRKTAADEHGRYRVLGLGPGVYRLEVAHPGFRTEVREGLRLDAGRTLPVDLQLQIGSASERVVVTGEAPLLSLSPTDWGTATDRREIESLPMNGRDLFDLASQEPGVNAPRNSTPELIRGIGARLSVNGGRPNQNSFRLDGIYINDAAGAAPASATGLLLGIEGIQELRMVTSPFSAEYGRAAAGAVVAVSRSGSNEVHGSVYEWLRNNATDARNFFDAPGSKVPPLRRNQFGALLSGPIVRNRLFLLGNYEGLRQSASRTERSITLGPEPRLGRLPSPDGSVRTVAVAAAVRPFFVHYPLPNGRDFGDGTGEYIAVLATPAREDFGAIKANFIASDRWRTAARYTTDAARTTTPDSFLSWDLFERSRYHMLHSDAQFTKSPYSLHSFRAGVSRILNDENYSVRRQELNDLEFIAGRGPGGLLVTGLSDTGPATLRLRPRSYFLRDYQVNYEVSHLRGSHTWKFGASYDLVRLDERSDRQYTGTVRFTSVLDFLQGRARTADFMMPGSDTRRRWEQHLFSTYLQHEVRLGRAGLALGVRYETYSTPDERDGKVATLRDPYHDLSSTVGGPLYVNPSRRNLAPRAAIAWDPTGGGKTILRAGGGVFFDLLGSKELLIAGVRVPPLYNLAQLNNPPFPNFVAEAARAVPSTAVDTVAFRPNQPYVLQYQFAIQRQVTTTALAQVSYNSSRGIHLMGFERNINLAIPQTLPDGRVFFATNAPKVNPAFGVISIRTSRYSSWYHSLNALFEQRWNRRVRFQAKYTLAKSLDDNSTLAFNDFINTAAMSTPHNHRLNWARSDFDARHVFGANFSVQLPGLHQPGARWFLDGWELQGLIRAQTGFPFAPSVGFDRARLQSGTNDLSQRPNLAATPGSRIVLGDPQRWFDPLAFGLPAEGFYGNLGRNAIEGPGVFGLDAALHKSLYSTERHRVHLRIEAFNATNHPNFQSPSSESLTLFDSSLRRIPSAGRLDRTSVPARQLQLGLKWTF